MGKRRGMGRVVSGDGAWESESSHFSRIWKSFQLKNIMSYHVGYSFLSFFIRLDFVYHLFSHFHGFLEFVSSTKVRHHNKPRGVIWISCPPKEAQGTMASKVLPQKETQEAVIS